MRFLSDIKIFSSIRFALCLAGLPLCLQIKAAVNQQIITNAKEWNPIYSISYLENDSAKAVLSDLAVSGVEWTYDSTQFRLFRWTEKGPSGNQWIEYSEENASLFEFIPGRLFWLKTRESKVINPGSPRVAIVQDTFEVTLASKQFTDFASPFYQNIAISDIRLATGDGMDSMDFFVWTIEENTVPPVKIYLTAPLYIPWIPGLDNQSSVICSDPLTGYSIYNRADNDLTLRIPRPPYSMPPPEMPPQSSEETAGPSPTGPIQIDDLPQHQQDALPINDLPLHQLIYEVPYSTKFFTQKNKKVPAFISSANGFSANGHFIIISVPDIHYRKMVLELLDIRGRILAEIDLSARMVSRKYKLPVDNIPLSPGTSIYPARMKLERLDGKKEKKSYRLIF
ncbi:MAG: hypothetical protein GF401_17760 [Chitinivibrionales bacterium]|nr:hypothetical protein [Chitinivibrionales bacterium]